MYVFFIFSSHLFIDRLYIFFIYLIGAMDMVWIKIKNISSSERPRLGMLPLEVAGSLELGSLTALPLTAHGSSTSDDLIPCMPAFSSAPPSGQASQERPHPRPLPVRCPCVLLCSVILCPTECILKKRNVLLFKLQYEESDFVL